MANDKDKFEDFLGPNDKVLSLPFQVGRNRLMRWVLRDTAEWDLLILEAMIERRREHIRDERAESDLRMAMIDRTIAEAYNTVD